MTLAQKLPMGALTWGHDGWGVREELAAQAVDWLAAVKMQVAASAGSKKARKKNPPRVPRPAYMEPKKSGRRIKSASDFAAFARGMGGPK